MKWKITLFGLLLCGFFSFFGFSSSTYAVDNISVTYNSPPSRWDNVFPTCTGDCLNDYQYLIIESSNLMSNYVSTSNLEVRYNGSNSSYIYYSVVSSKSFYSLPFNGSPNNYMQFGPDISFGGATVTFILTNSLDTPCDCPDPEPCPVVPDTPYAEKFDNIEKAIYVCGAILIMLYFFYCIYRMIIKGSGVN